MKLAKVWILAVSVVASGIIAAAINRPVGAVDCDAGSARGITVQTASERLRFKPGERLERVMRVKNNGCEELNFRVEAVPYAPGENYANAFDIQNKWTQISRYISFKQTQFKLAVGESVDVPFTIAVPGNDVIAGGGQYAAIAIVGERTSGSGGVNIIPRVMYQIYGQMAGEVKEDVRITNQSVPFWTDGANGLVTTFTVENGGNVDFTAYGKLTVSGFFGGVVYETGEKQRPRVFAFPETKPPAKEVVWENARIGLFWVTQDVEINGKINSITRLTIVMPMWLLIVLLIGVTALVFLVVFNVVRYKKKKTLKRRN
jgi:hypothetical protein